MTDADYNLFLSETHPSSRMTVVLEDDGDSGWAYLTASGELEPVGDVWVYNRAPAIGVEDIPRFRGRQPPASSDVVDGFEVCSEPRQHSWAFHWNSTGNAVAVFRDGEALALLEAGKALGRSKHLTSRCPWGEPLLPDALGDAGVEQPHPGHEKQ